MEIFSQTLTKHIKIIEPELVQIIEVNGIERVTFEPIFQNHTHFLSFRRFSGPKTSRKALELTRHKKAFWKCRTPSTLRPFLGQTVRVYRDMFCEDKDELFRLEPPDFQYFKSPLFARRFLNPKFTKSGIFVVPKLYANKYLDETVFIAPRISFDQNTRQMISQGQILAYVTQGKQSLSSPLYKDDSGLRTKTLKHLLDLVGTCGKKLENFKYAGTSYQEYFCRFGIMIFRDIVEGESL